MTFEQLLALRNKMKAEKPLFIRQEGHKRKKLEEKWRRPKGIQSKLRRKFKSRRFHPSRGFSSPAAVRFLNKEGLKRRLVRNIRELETVDPKTEIVIIQGAVGQKMRVEIAKRAMGLKVKVENMKDPAAFVQEVENAFKKRKEEKAKKEKKAAPEQKKEKADEKKAEHKEEKKHDHDQKEKVHEEKVDVHEEKKKAEKEEHRKVLEKRQ